MIEKYTYQCEVCGKEFAFEDECREHEMKCKTAGLEKSVVMMDDDGEILSLDDMHTAIEKSYAIYVECKEAADILWELFDKDGYCSPITDIDTPIQYPAFFTYNSHWRYMNNLEEEYNRLLELKTTAENTLLH